MNGAQKTPLSRTLNAFVAGKALDEIAKRGQALPGTVVSVTGALITVNFEVSGLTLPQVTMPLFGPEYIRYPIKAGDLGAAFPVDAYMGGISGIGGGTADTTPRGNLSTLVWFPCGNTDWVAVDPNAVTAYAPNGVVLRDTGSRSVETLTPASIAFATPSVSTTQNLSVGTGWSGVFTTMTGQTVTVQQGIIINVA